MSYRKVVITEYGGPDVLQVVEEPQLPEPQQGEVRVKVLATSAAFTDTMIRKGNYPDVKKRPPFSPGYDLVGVVDKAGPDVLAFDEGQAVADLTVTGAYAEYICLPAARLVPVPEGLSPAAAVSMILTYVTAYQMLHRSANVEPGDSVLVHGAGGAVGTALLQLSSLENLRVFGTASGSKHDHVATFGAQAINYRQEDFREVVLSKVPEGVNAAFDPIGGTHFERSFQTVAEGGTLVAFGFYNHSMGRGGSIPLDLLRLKLWDLLPNQKATTFYSISPWRKEHPDWFREDLGLLFDYAADGKIRPVIWKEMPLQEAARAHEMIESALPEGKIILTTK